MSDIPIIFSAPMVRALLDGRKTMTRRLAFRFSKDSLSKYATAWQARVPGDRLWVRETWCNEPIQWHPGPTSLVFSADYPDVVTTRSIMEQHGVKWRSPIHMPRWASRLTLIVTATKIERLLDISEADARAEGFVDSQLNDGFEPRDFGGGWTIESPGTSASAAGNFQIMWSKLHPDWDGYSAPEVVALTFTVHKTNVDALPKAEAA